MSDDAETIRAGFRETVYGTREPTDRLETDESQAVGQKDGDAESTGHRYGRRIVDLLGTKGGDLVEDDLDAMRKVTDYVHRHLAQRPSGDVEHSRWRYSLVSWTQSFLRGEAGTALH